MKFLIILFLIASISMAKTLTLDEAIDRALLDGWQSSLDEIDSMAGVWQRRGAVAGYMPQVSYGASLLSMDPPPFPLQTRRSLTHELTFTQPVINGGAEIVAIRMARASNRARSHGYEARRWDVVAEVEGIYYDLVLLTEQIALLESDLNWYRENLSRSKKRFQLGTASRADILQWKSSLLERELQLAELKDGRDALSDLLKFTMGNSSDIAPIAVEPFSTFENRRSDWQPATDIPDSSAQIRSLRAWGEVTKEAERLVLTGALPSLNLRATYNLPYRWDTDIDRERGDGIWAVGAHLSLPLFNGGRVYTALQEKRYETIKAYEEIAVVREQLSLRMAQILRSLETAEVRLNSTEARIELQRENLEILKERYEAGLVSQIDYEQVRQAYEMSRIIKIETVLNILKLQREYNTLAGGEIL